MAELNIAAIREALDEATCKGEAWYNELRDPRCNFSDGSPVCMVQCDEGCVAFDIAEPDAHLIANAPAWLTQLCDAVEAKDAQIEALRELLQKCSRYVTEGGGIGLQDEIDELLAETGKEGER